MLQAIESVVAFIVFFWVVKRVLKYLFNPEPRLEYSNGSEAITMGPWKKWFAWRRVQIHGRSAWLEMIKRRKIVRQSKYNGTFTFWQYS